MIANLINLLTAAVLVSRAKEKKSLEEILGVIVVLFVIPLILILVLNVINEKDWWCYVLIIPIVVYLIIELILDYILKIQFRTTWLHGFYISIYYLGLFGMIGYSFAIGKIYGFITLITYFFNLGITGYLLSNRRYKDKMYS